MSWQCPICETVNQDVTPICTVCDHLAPVIQSYLSLEAIELSRKYNENLDIIHSLEAEGNYEMMFDTAMKAISIYKENGLALEKAKHALLHLNENKLKNQILGILNNFITEKNFALASVLFRLLDLLSIDIHELASLRVETENELFQESDIDKIIKRTYKAIVEIDTTEALQIVEEGILKYPKSESLQHQRDDIKHFISCLNKVRESEDRKYPRPPHKLKMQKSTSTPNFENMPIVDLGTKPKYPKVNRK